MAPRRGTCFPKRSTAPRLTSRGRPGHWHWAQLQTAIGAAHIRAAEKGAGSHAVRVIIMLAPRGSMAVATPRIETPALTVPRDRTASQTTTIATHAGPDSKSSRLPAFALFVLFNAAAHAPLSYLPSPPLCVGTNPTQAGALAIRAPRGATSPLTAELHALRASPDSKSSL